MIMSFWKCFKSFEKHEKNNENITINALEVLLKTPFSLYSFQIITNDSIGRVQTIVTHFYVTVTIFLI